MPQTGMPDRTVTRIELHDEGGRTRMVLTDGPYPDGSPAEAGGSQSFDKLARRVAP
jgi:hypothetical protein